jgi:hypothetical protein
MDAKKNFSLDRKYKTKCIIQHENHARDILKRIYLFTNSDEKQHSYLKKK